MQAHGSEKWFTKFLFSVDKPHNITTKQTWDCCVFLLWLLLVVELCFAVGLMTEAISPSSSKTIFLLGLSVPPRGKHTSALILPALFFKTWKVQSVWVSSPLPKCFQHGNCPWTLWWCSKQLMNTETKKVYCLVNQWECCIPLIAQSASTKNILDSFRTATPQRTHFISGSTLFLLCSSLWCVIPVEHPNSCSVGQYISLILLNTVGMY